MEVVKWSTLRHPNILPLLGVTITETRLVVVLEWMERGNINEFTKANAKADRLGLVRLLFMVHLPSLITDDCVITIAWRRR